MFCKNCGTEIKNNGKFCGNCGTQIQQIITKNNIVISDSLSRNNSIVVLFVVAAFIHILEIILWFVKCLKATGFGIISESVSMHSAFEGYAIFSVITVIACLISAGLCILPVIKINPNQRRRLIFPKITTIWVFGWFLIELIGGLIESSDSHGMIDISLTFGGWLLVIASITSIVLLFIISSKTQKYKK